MALFEEGGGYFCGIDETVVEIPCVMIATI